MHSTTNTFNRRQFLRGSFNKKLVSIRPPWALAEHDFLNACSRCNECIRKCPEKVIVKGDGGYPGINFDSGGCTFCKECVAACEDGALSINIPEQLPWNITATVSSECISMHGVTCRSCSDSCEEEAITFRLQVGGISQPEINSKSCTGCGYCVVPCPVKAITVSENQVQEEYNYEHN